MGKTKAKSQIKNKDKSIEVIYSYKEINNTAQNALEKFLSNLNKKSGFAAPPVAEVRSNIAFPKPVAF